MNGYERKRRPGHTRQVSAGSEAGSHTAILHSTVNLSKLEVLAYKSIQNLCLFTSWAVSAYLGTGTISPLTAYTAITRGAAEDQLRGRRESFY